MRRTVDCLTIDIGGTFGDQEALVVSPVEELIHLGKTALQGLPVLDVARRKILASAINTSRARFSFALCDDTSVAVDQKTAPAAVAARQAHSAKIEVAS
ncbi:hypothetical protein CAI21_22440 [Alkalilimnicola ehrlichii]|nr:hypothetical protein CAI21_22440 [Alkalilimnicola ehrlichii]